MAKARPLITAAKIGKEMIIGGLRCNEHVEERFIESDGTQLTDSERESLWNLFVQIGRYWDAEGDVTHDSTTLKSSWLEFIEARTIEPRTKEDPRSYTGEYRNALIVFAEMQECYSEKKVLQKMLFEKTVEVKEDIENKRLGHAKTFVINEFIKVFVVSGGFMSFAGKNYNGFIKGSRFNEEAPVSVYPEEVKN